LLNLSSFGGTAIPITIRKLLCISFYDLSGLADRHIFDYTKKENFIFEILLKSGRNICALLFFLITNISTNIIYIECYKNSVFFDNMIYA